MCRALELTVYPKNYYSDGQPWSTPRQFGYSASGPALETEFGKVQQDAERIRLRLVHYRTSFRGRRMGRSEARTATFLKRLTRSLVGFWSGVRLF